MFILRSRNFSSNSQPRKRCILCIDTVVYTAKQKLFKQFTTNQIKDRCRKALLFILRSRNFSSNSQLWAGMLLVRWHCCLYCEAETFQAIHNCLTLPKSRMSTVVYTAKQKLFKQFTTDPLVYTEFPSLLFILRSRNFSSNSQRKLVQNFTRTNCCLYCEAETFQAIHNLLASMDPSISLLFILRSRNFSSNSQLHLIDGRIEDTVVYTAKQKLFKQFTTCWRVWTHPFHCCLYCEAETFQAIHNIFTCSIFCSKTVVYTAKQKLFKQFITNMSKSNLIVKILY